MMQSLKLFACNGCSDKTNPFRSLPILERHATQAGWTWFKHAGRRAVHFCPKCSAERAARRG